jgi:succinate dehydrogenase / fumarate reductase membrane anchor subunit
MVSTAKQHRTALARARGLGAAHHGVGHFITERATSIALVPLCLWAVWAALKIAPGGADGAAAFLASPVNAVLAVLLVVVAARHTQIGMQVIIEDYVDHTGTRVSLLLANTGVAWLAAALAVFSILKVALPGLASR